MRNKFCTVIIVLSLVVFLLYSCDQSAKRKSNDKLHITVSILPQKYFVERIGDEYVDVNVMVKPGASPATYEPKPAQLKALSKADAYILIGVPFEKAWLNRISSANREMLVVDTTQGIERMPMRIHHHHNVEHQEESVNEEIENPDPHIWVSPRLVKIQIVKTYETLVQLDSKHKEVYQKNLADFQEDIDNLDAEIRQTLSDVKKRKFMVFHPSWGYFARDYGLEMIPVEVGGQEPSAAELGEIITEAKAENIKVIFAQPEFSTKAAETIANEINGKVLLISPLSPDWLNNLRKVSNTFAEVLNYTIQ